MLLSQEYQVELQRQEDIIDRTLTKREKLLLMRRHPRETQRMIATENGNMAELLLKTTWTPLKSQITIKRRMKVERDLDEQSSAITHCRSLSLKKGTNFKSSKGN